MMRFYLLGLLMIVFASCKKNDADTAEPKLIFRIRFDSTQARLNSEGLPAPVPNGHAAGYPVFNKISTDYIELAANDTTVLGQGTILYKGAETNAGGSTAIDYQNALVSGNNEVFFALSLKNIPPGEYEWLRISFGYQNYSVRYHLDTTINNNIVNGDFTGTVASFIGYNTYISSYQIKTQTFTLNENREQGYWAFETVLSADSLNEVYTVTGQSPAGATTVVNPIFATSPVPPGSSVATAAFVPGKLVITGKETGNIVIELAVSTNQSFEWMEIINNGKWDPAKGEQVIDMGLRGMIPVIKTPG